MLNEINRIMKNANECLRLRPDTPTSPFSQGIEPSSELDRIGSRGLIRRSKFWIRRIVRLFKSKRLLEGCPLLAP